MNERGSNGINTIIPASIRVPLDPLRKLLVGWIRVWHKHVSMLPLKLKEFAVTVVPLSRLVFARMFGASNLPTIRDVASDSLRGGVLFGNGGQGGNLRVDFHFGRRSSRNWNGQRSDRCRLDLVKVQIAVVVQQWNVAEHFVKLVKDKIRRRELVASNA